jgi:hypothetical protein
MPHGHGEYAEARDQQQWLVKHDAPVVGQTG